MEAMSRVNAVGRAAGRIPSLDRSFLVPERSTKGQRLKRVFKKYRVRRKQARILREKVKEHEARILVHSQQTMLALLQGVSQMGPCTREASRCQEKIEKHKEGVGVLELRAERREQRMQDKEMKVKKIEIEDRRCRQSHHCPLTRQTQRLERLGHT